LNAPAQQESFALRLLAIAAIFALVAAASSTGGAVQLSLVAPPEPLVSTLGGNGAFGDQDGPLASASFMEPDGIAVAADGTMYVADGSANEVRAIANGTVNTVAGSSKHAPGFQDGPSGTALFDRPVGVAVAKDGTLYVADSRNHRIRRIKHGVVSTLAGSAATGKADGPGAAATFTFPKGVAVDADGNVYVADYGVGIRKISPGGTVSSTNFPTTGLVYAVAARGSGADLIVDFTDNQGIHIVSGGKHRGLAIATDREPYNENNQVGRAFGIAIVDANSAVITDLWTNAVRYVTFADPPFRPAAKTRTLAGGKRDGALEIGGYRDGEGDVALVKSPYGIATMPGGRIVVADTGNRRIREIAGLDSRLPIASDLDNFTFPPHTYRIALIGDSYTWNNVLWPESMGGILESGLAARPDSGLKLKAGVLLLSASGGTLRSASDFITTNLGDGQADLVILVYDKLALGHEFDTSPQLRDGSWRSVIPERVRDLASRLRKQGTKFALLPIPNAGDVSPVEGSAYRETGDDEGRFNFSGLYRSGVDFENAFAEKQLHVIRLIGTLADLDRKPDTPSLYNAYDTHLTTQGSIVVGNAILADLLAWKPWADDGGRR